MLYYGATDIGKRRDANQDNFYAGEPAEGYLLLAVCDGMGGVRGGELASSLALSTFVDVMKAHLPPKEGKDEQAALTSALRLALATANEAVFVKGSGDSELAGMGTTLAAVLIKDGTVYCIHVGDSRVYLVEDRKLVRLTRDHSYVQMLVDMGELTPKEALTNPRRNIITKAVGTESAVEGDLLVRPLNGPPPSSILLCSDGLTGYVSDGRIRQILLGSRERTPEKMVEKLIDAANRGGGGDNITAVVALFDPAPPAAG